MMLEMKNILLLLVGYTIQLSHGECLSDSSLDSEFLGFIQATDPSVQSIPVEGSCCQSDVCGIPCPVPVDDPAPGKKKIEDQHILMCGESLSQL